MQVFLRWFSIVFVFFFFKQKTAYEVRISDWSSDVCSSDLSPLRFPLSVARSSGRPEPFAANRAGLERDPGHHSRFPPTTPDSRAEIGRASCRERVCQYV